MLTKSDLSQAIADSIASYPTLAVYYNAGDPRILQPLEAIATMLAMTAAYLEVAQAEAFNKTRESTVLADASNRGVIRKAVPAKARITVNNKGTVPITISASRLLLDSDGHVWRVVTPGTAAGNGTATVEAIQELQESFNHTVSGSEPFYAIAVPEKDDMALSAIAVTGTSGITGDFTYKEKFTNTLPGDKVFHVETNDFSTTYVRFGVDAVVGIQPPDGTVFSIKVSYSFGDVRPKTGSPFTYQYLSSPDEANITMAMDALLKPGQNPPSVSYLRDLIRYPSVYDHTAVYLGEFDFLVRRNFQTLKFLSVWNETMEEKARGPNVDNINVLFVACMSDLGIEADLTETTTPVAPTVITTLTATQDAIKAAILQADNSYRVRFLTPVRYVIGVDIQVTVPSSYVATEVANQIKNALLDEYGEASTNAKHGRNKPNYQQIYALLKDKIQALQSISADFTMTITNTASQDRPEVWRYVTSASITVTVNLDNNLPPYWGG